MIEINDIEKAIAENKPLFYDRAEISYEACEFLLEQPLKIIDLLFSEFPKWDSKQKPHVCICCKCPCCNKSYSIDVSKSKLKEGKRRGTGYLTRIDYGLSYRQENEIRNYIKNYPDDNLWDMINVCNECMTKYYEKIENIYNEFYNNPLEWVNTHSEEVPSWQWKQISKLFAYPHGYENKPEGWKYCGVRYLTKDSKSLSEVFDQNYYNWKYVKDKTKLEWGFSTSHETLKKILGEKLYSATTPLAYKRTIKIAEKIIDGLLDKADLQAILRYVVTESNNILKDFKRLNESSHILSFGKYKGLTVHEVIEIDRGYISWMMNEIEGFSLDEKEYAHYNGEKWKTEIVNNETEIEI